MTLCFVCLQVRATFKNRVAVLRDACAGLVAMHAENYLHRDVKVKKKKEEDVLSLLCSFWYLHGLLIISLTSFVFIIFVIFIYSRTT